MREETRKKLNQAIWAERIKKAGIGAAVLAAIGLVFAYQNLDLQDTKTHVPGTVASVDALVSKQNPADGLNVEVKLDGGQHVRVIMEKTREPKIGDRIELTEHHHGSGRVTHTFK